MTDAETLQKLQKEWEGRWHIWRSVGSKKLPSGESVTALNCWVATRIRPDAGPYTTVMCDTADGLRVALVEQKTLLAEGTHSLTIAAEFSG
jgi:hypothetical protein